MLKRPDLDVCLSAAGKSTSNNRTGKSSYHTGLVNGDKRFDGHLAANNCRTNHLLLDKYTVSVIS